MTQLLQNAVYGTVLILAVAALRGALKDRLLPEARLALWAVCLFRLFTPSAPTSPLSFWGLFGWGTWGQSVSAPAAPSAPSAPAAPAAPLPFWELPASAPAAPAAPTAPSASAVLTAVWIAVGVILAARYALAYVRTRRAVGRAIALGREDARYAALPKFARLREGPLDGAPLTFGVVRPTVVLTPGLEGAELACVLAHEGVHARRRHNLWHYAAAAALTVFWWDPAVWLMVRLIRRDIELSCDRAAVRRLGEGKRAEYASALITLSTQAEGGAFCHGFGPKRTEERIISIMKYKKTTVAGIALTLALVLAVTVGFASNPGAGIPDEESTTSSAPAPLVWVGSFGPEGELLKFTIGMDYLEQLLMEHVTDGSMTEEGAAYYLGKAKALSQDGVKLEWTVPEDIRLFVDKGSTEMTFNIIYWLDKNGNKMYLDPVEMLTAYVFAPNDAAAANDQSGADTGDQDRMYICTRADCGDTGVHKHDGVTYMTACTREDCAVRNEHYHDAEGQAVHIAHVEPLYDEPVTDDDELCELPPAYIGSQGQDGDGPIGCPPEVIDKDFYQNYPEANYQDFEHHESGHHSDSHHSGGHH